MKKFVIIFLLYTSAAMAETPSVKVRGQVVDSSNALILGARVALLDGTKEVAAAVVGPQGGFELSVAPGSYDMEISAEGFQTAHQTVQVAADMQLSVMLELGSIQQSVTVQADQDLVSLDANNNLSAMVLDEEAIKALPDNEDELTEYLTELAGPRAAAAGGVDFIVDGFTGGALPTKDQILQIRINNNPYSTEYSRPGFGRIEIITKPGTGQFRGSFGFNLRDDALNARNALSSSKLPYEQRNFQTSFSGPLINNRLSLSLNATRGEQSAGDSIRAITADGVISAPIVQPTVRENFSARGQYQLAEKHTLNFNFGWNSNTQKNQGAGGFSLLERGSTTDSNQLTMQLRETSVLSSKWINEARFEFVRGASSATPNTDAVAINVLDAFQSGGAINRTDNRDWHTQAANMLMFSSGNLTFKTGVQWDYTRTRAISESNFLGTYVFPDLDAYLAGAPTTFTITQGDPSLRYSTSEFAAFAQTDIRLGSKFLISPGLRYEVQSNLSDYNNVDPRLSFSYSLNKSTVLRGGIGIFHQRLTGSTIETLTRLDGSHQNQIVISNPSFPDPFLDGISQTIQQSIRVRSDDLAAPYTFNSSVSLEHAWKSGLSLTASYDFIRGVHLYRSRDINAPLETTGIRPDPTGGNVFQLESTGLSTFQGLTFSIRKPITKAVSLFANYTLSSSHNNTDGAFSLPADNYDLALEWGRSADDRRHQLTTGFNLKLPWSLTANTLLRFQSSRPYNITTGFDNNGDTTINDRPFDIVRNSGDGPSFFDMSLNLSRTFKLTRDEGGANLPDFRAQLPAGGPRGGAGGAGRGGFGGPQGRRAGASTGPSLTFFVNAQNLLNHTNYANYSGVLTSPFFGLATAALSPRQIEAGIRLNF